MNSFGLGILSLLLFALAWGVYVNWRLYAGTHLRCLAFRLGATVVVSSAQVAAPSAVRYAWADDPVCNLVNQVGLPASPFRSGQPRYGQ